MVIGGTFAIGWTPALVEGNAVATAHLSQLGVEASTDEVVSAGMELLSWIGLCGFETLSAEERSVVLDAASR